MRQHQLPVIIRERVLPDVRHHHGLLAKRRGAAGARAFGYRHGANGVHKVLPEAGRAAVAQLTGLYQQDGAQAAGRAFLNQPHHGVERLAQRRTAGNHRQHLLLPLCKNFNRLDLGDVVKDHQAADQPPAWVIQRPRGHAQDFVVDAGPAQHHLHVVSADAEQRPHQRPVGKRVRSRTVEQQKFVGEPPVLQRGASPQGRAVVLARAGVHAQKAPVGIDGDDAFVHAVEDQVEQNALLVGMLQGGVERCSLRLQRLGHAVERLADQAHLVLRPTAAANARLEVAAGDFISLFQDLMGRIDNQALSHRPRAGDAKSRQRQKGGKFVLQQAARAQSA